MRNLALGKETSFELLLRWKKLDAFVNILKE